MEGQYGDFTHLEEMTWSYLCASHSHWLSGRWAHNPASDCLQGFETFSNSNKDMVIVGMPILPRYHVGSGP
jgi:hypothetical protein